MADGGDGSRDGASEPVETRIAEWIGAREFEIPGILLAETLKPVAWFLAQSVHFFTPHLDIMSYLHPALREGNVRSLAGFLEDQGRIERFIQTLEESARRRVRRRRQKG